MIKVTHDETVVYSPRELIAKCLEMSQGIPLSGYFPTASEKHFIINTPRTVTSVSDMADVPSHSCKAWCSVSMGENSKNETYLVITLTS